MLPKVDEHIMGKTPKKCPVSTVGLAGAAQIFRRWKFHNVCLSEDCTLQTVVVQLFFLFCESTTKYDEVLRSDAICSQRWLQFVALPCVVSILDGSECIFNHNF